LLCAFGVAVDAIFHPRAENARLRESLNDARTWIVNAEKLDQPPKTTMVEAIDAALKG
jgi:hypothetical protein